MKFSLTSITRKLLPPTAVISMIGSTAVGQLVSQSPQPTGINLGGSAFTSPTHGFVVGDNNTLLETFDAGETWIRRMYTGISSDPFYTITFADSQHGYIAGNNQDAFRTVDGGQNWTRMPSMAGGSVRALDFVTPTTGFAGYNGAITWTPDGGSAWSARGVYPDAPIVFGMDFRDAQVGLAAGIRSSPHHDGGIYRTTDGGNTWSLVSDEGTNDVLWISSTSALAVGGYDVLRSDDEGQSWHIHAWGAIETGLSDIDRAGASDTIAGVSGKGDIWVSLDLGYSWQQRVIGIGVLPANWSVEFLDEVNAWVVGANGLTYRTIDGGVSWTLMNSGCGDGVQDIDFAPGDDFGIAVTHRGFVFTTHDRGQQWDVSRLQWTGIVFGREEGLRTVQIVDPDFVITGGAGGVLWRTEEGPGNWVNVSDPNQWGANFEIRDIHMADSYNGWLGGFYGSGSLYRTYNGGYWWSEVEQVLGSIVAVDVQGQRVWAATGGDVIYYSHDFGETWTARTLPSGSYNLTDLEFVDENLGWAVGYYGTLAKSTNGGVSWTRVTAPQNETYLNIEMNGPSEILILGYDGSTFRNFYKRSTNGGQTWTRTNLNQFEESLETALLRPSGRFWLGGSNGKIVYQPAPPLQISLPDPLVPQVAPGEPFSFDVRILAGEQQIVEGSPTMWLRRSPTAAFEAIPLTPGVGDLFTATLPPLRCSDAPHFYFSATGEDGATQVHPIDAPATLLSTRVGVIEYADLLAADFDDGLPSGWTTNGLWHITSTACLPTGACGSGGWAYFGQDATCTFNTGARTAGVLRSPTLSLPALQAGQSMNVSFCSALDTEYPNGAYGDDDQAQLWWVRSNGQVSPVHWFTDHNSATQQVFPLNLHAGTTGRLEWRFDSMNTYMNNFRGWHIDNVRVVGPQLVCADAAAGDTDGDGDIDLTDLATLLIAFGLCEGQHGYDAAADFDAGGCVDLIDLALLLTNFGS